MPASKRPGDDTPKSSSYLPSKRFRGPARTLQGIKIFLIDAKLDAVSASELRALAEQHSNGVVMDGAERKCARATDIQITVLLSEHGGSSGLMPDCHEVLV